MTKHPLEHLLPSRGSRMVAVVLLAIATLWVSWIMQRLARGIEPGILALEFAATPANAKRVLDQWGVSGEARMLAQIGLDNWWLALYSTTIALLCVMIAVRLRGRAPRWSAIGVILAWCVWGAALLDRLENYALVSIVNGEVNAAWTITAFVCASIKFLIVIICLLYIIGSPFFSRVKTKTATDT
jgi:hypothetical protein